MDQMCMSMVKLQGRLQFSQARAGADGVVDVDERWWWVGRLIRWRLEGWKAYLWWLGRVFFSDVTLLYVVCFWFISGGGC